MYTWKEITNIDTIQYSDSSEISPDKEYCINCCYQLEESDKRRNGSVYLIKLNNNSANVVTSDSNIDGILDSCWISSNNFVLAGSLGNLYFYSHNNSDSIELNRTIPINNESLCLSVDYHSNKLICSSSRGELVLLNMNDDILFQDTVHDFEAWVCHLSRHHDNLYFSGGDDCKFNGFDLRCNEKIIFTKKFDMGCTSIQSHPIDRNLVSTGSYDENLKIWDLRNMRSAVKSFMIGGGIWRHKWSPENVLPMILVAGMYDGFSVVNTESELSDYSIRLRDTSHAPGGLAYGADWVMKENRFLITASSFYDHRWSLSELSF